MASRMPQPTRIRFPSSNPLGTRTDNDPEPVVAAAIFGR
jgi:hypothetical protein